ncbi:MAG: flagellar biosynthetic protein FliO [Herbaspirillum sp.]
MMGFNRFAIFVALALSLVCVANLGYANVGAETAAVGTAKTITTPAVTSNIGSAPSAGSLLQVLFGLIVVLALMATIAWLMKRFGVTRHSGNSVVKIIGGVSVGNRERVLVVEVGEQWIVVGVAAGRVSALANMPRQSGVELSSNDSPPVRNFSSWLKQTVDRRNGKQ